MQERDEELKTPEANVTRSESFDSSDVVINNLVLDTPAKVLVIDTFAMENGASGSGSNPKKREIIDLDDYEEDATINKKPMVKVKKEEWSVGIFINNHVSFYA